MVLNPAFKYPKEACLPQLLIYLFSIKGLVWQSKFNAQVAHVFREKATICCPEVCRVICRSTS